MQPASFMQTERFWHNVATYMINLCVDHVLFSLIEFISVKADQDINSISETTHDQHRG